MSQFHRKLFALLALLPFINIYPYAPYGAWIPETIALLLTALILFKPVVPNPTTMTFNTVQVSLIGLLIAIILSYVINRPSYSSITAITVFYLFCGFFLSQHISQLKEYKADLIASLAYGILIGSLLQILIAATQISGLFNFYVNFVDGMSLLVPQFSLSTTPYGLIFQRNLFADYIFMGGLAACYLYAEKRLSTLSFVLCLISICTFSSFSMSRSVIAYTLAALLLLPLMYYKGKSTAFFSKILLIYIATTLSFQFIIPLLSDFLVAYFPFLFEGSGLTRLQSGLDEARKIEWQKAWYAFLQHPLFGTGIGTNAAASLQYKATFQYSNFKEITAPIFTHCHNMFLQFLTETGIIGGIALLGACIVALWTFIKGEFNNHKAFSFLCISTLFIHSQLEYPLWYAFFFILFICFISSEAKPVYTFNIKPHKIAYTPIAIIIFCLFGLYSNIQLISLGRETDTQAGNDLDLQHAIALSNNFLVADLAESYVLRHVALDSKGLDYKLYLSQKQIKFRPSPTTVFRHAIFLSYKGQNTEAEKILDDLLTQHPPLLDQFTADFIPIQHDKRLLPVNRVLSRHLIVRQATKQTHQ